MAIHESSAGYTYAWDALFEREDGTGTLVNADEYLRASESEDVIDALQLVADSSDGFIASLSAAAAGVIEAQRDLIGDLSARVDWLLQTGMGCPIDGDFIFPDGLHWSLPEIDE